MVCGIEVVSRDRGGVWDVCMVGVVVSGMFA